MMTRKNVRHHFTIRLIIQVAAICAFFFITLTPNSASALDILIGTEPEGTFSHFTGRTICRIISRHAEDITAKPYQDPTPSIISRTCREAPWTSVWSIHSC